MPRKSSKTELNTKVESSKIVKKIPATETGHGVICRTRSGKEYRITQNPEKKRHTLWRVVDGGYEKLGSSDSPNNLYSLFDWEE